MDLDLDGSTVVVTGAGRGIGLVVARAFAREGARVVAGSLTVSDELADLARDTHIEPLRWTSRRPPGPPHWP